MFYLAKAIQAANTIDDVYAIRDAFLKAFPLLADNDCNENHGISSNGRVHLMVDVQKIKNGKYSKSELYVWRAKTQAEFDKVKKVSKFSYLEWFKSKMENVE